MKREIIEFLKQYPKYADETVYIVESRESERFGGDYEIFVWELFDEGEAQDYVGCWWCKLWNNEQETTYEFEKEVEVNALEMRVEVETPLELDIIYYKETPNDFRSRSDIEESVVEEYTKDNLEEIKKMVCEKIMNGEIKLDIYSPDGDSYPAPLSQINKIYKV